MSAFALWKAADPLLQLCDLLPYLPLLLQVLAIDGLARFKLIEQLLRAEGLASGEASPLARPFKFPVFLGDDPMPFSQLIITL
jgi:hypothetical protein